jgi:hypothetical protein
MTRKRFSLPGLKRGRAVYASVAITGGALIGTVQLAVGKPIERSACGPILCYTAEIGVPDHAHTGEDGTPPWGDEWGSAHTVHVYYDRWHPEFRHYWLHELPDEGHDHDWQEACSP